MRALYFVLFFLCNFLNVSYSGQGITFPVNDFFMGDPIISFSWAHILSSKYDIPLYITAEANKTELRHFNISKMGLPIIDDLKTWKVIRVVNDKDIQDHIHEDNVMFTTSLWTSCLFSEDLYMPMLKEALNLNDPIEFEKPPSDMISVVVHIRKGIQGVAPWFGSLASKQYYLVEQGCVKYNYLPKRRGSIQHHPYFPLLYVPRVCEKEATDCLPTNILSYTYFDKVPDWETKYPPEQYYVEVLKEISRKFDYKSLFVRIITDDNKDPLALVNRIKQAVNIPNMHFYYQDLNHLSSDDRLRSEIYALSQHDIYVRSQSYFSRIGEIIGNHKLVYVPTAFKWEDNSTLIMTKVSVKCCSDF